MKSTREKILRTLLAFPESTINDLAEAVGINGISIRHHLTALEADDLVTSSEQRHGVGRPRLIYSLTDKGIEEFPSSYLRLTQRLIKALGDKMSKAEVEKIFAEIGTGIAKQYAEELDGKSTEERLRLLKSILTKEGFIVEWEKGEDAFTLTSLSCPYLRIGLDHPEICALDHTMIKTILAAPVEIEACILDNDERCVYHIPVGDEA
ncbi:winged helix-turn-helix transcriptional regulator [bacterium]|nr:winged helix-turn-helix transcriptional regulator [bacterium]